MAVPLQMGVKTGTVAKALTNKHRRLPSIGACFDVCVAGFALQGGLSLNFRYHGTAADFIQSMDVVTIGCGSPVPSSPCTQWPLSVFCFELTVARYPMCLVSFDLAPAPSVRCSEVLVQHQSGCMVPATAVRPPDAVSVWTVAQCLHRTRLCSSCEGHAQRSPALASRLGDLRSMCRADRKAVRRTISADREPDLFWGMRGAGGNLGVAIEYTTHAFAVPDNVRTAALLC